MPVIEAMKCGAPVVASHNSSLKEIAGDSALLVDPYNINEIAFAIQSIATDPDLKNMLIKKGKKQAENFSWKKSAKELLKLFNL